MSVTSMLQDSPVIKSNPEVKPTADSLKTISEIEGEVFGFEISKIKKIGTILATLGLAPYSTEKALDKLRPAVDLLPLVETIQSGHTLKQGTIRSYIEPLEEVSRAVRVGNRLAKGSILRNAFETKLDKAVPLKARETVEKTRQSIEKIPSLEVKIKHIGSFENPKKQFEKEVSNFAAMVTDAVIKERNNRVLNIDSSAQKPSLPKGIKGFILKVVLKVRGFFGRFSSPSKTKQDTDITAYDAGSGLEKVLMPLLDNQSQHLESFPLILGLIKDQLPCNVQLTEIYYR